MRDELDDLTRRAVAAVGGRDLGVLESLLAEEFTLTTGRPGAEVRDRAAWMAITAERYEVDDARVDELQVHPLGADGAVVRYRLVQRARMDGADRSGAFRVTDSWARREGVWQLVARHSTAVPAGSGRLLLRVRPERFALLRETVPPAPLRAEVVRDDERTVVRAEHDGGWAAIEVEGPLDHGLTGVLAGLSGTLAAAGVPIFAVSTYDTDVLLVETRHLDRAVAALRASGEVVST